jgi:hypothetical protein
MIMHGKIHMPRRLAMLMCVNILFGSMMKPPVWLCSKAPVRWMMSREREKSKANEVTQELDASDMAVICAGKLS